MCAYLPLQGRPICLLAPSPWVADSAEQVEMSVSLLLLARPRSLLGARSLWNHGSDAGHLHVLGSWTADVFLAAADVLSAPTAVAIQELSPAEFVSSVGCPAVHTLFADLPAVAHDTHEAECLTAEDLVGVGAPPVLDPSSVSTILACPSGSGLQSLLPAALASVSVRPVAFQLSASHFV